MKVTALSNQSLIDLAIQTSGSIESAFNFARKNGISVTESIPAGNEFEAVSTLNRDIADYYNAKNLRPATSMEYMEAPAGIGFMAINYNFTIA
jgi:hypothetical protein